MEQRPLRLGDILDDYCPRERRLTNHAIVAMIEEDIRQTRCTTCDAEHAYKGGKVPKRRKKETPAALYKEVLAGMPETEAAPILASAAHAASDTVAIDPDDSETGDSDGDAGTAAELAPEAAIEQPAVAAVPQPQIQRVAAPAQPAPVSPSEDGSDGSIGAVEVEEGPVHRPLIRAQLPRIEGQKEERRLPEFTIRQATRGPGHFRGADSRMKQQRPGGPGNGNGNRPHGAARFAGPRPSGPGRGPGGRSGPAAGGFRAGQPRHGGGKKRSR
jgi:hypothetical protein